jgi:hypothetical protein
MVFPSHTSKDASNDPPEQSMLQPAPAKATRHTLRRQTVAGVLAVSLLVMASLLLFRHFYPALMGNIPIGKPIGAPVSPPVTVHSEVHGVAITLGMTPGPYFLSELVSVTLTLTNHSQHRVMLGGPPAINTCNGAFNVTMTGGHEPHYDLPGRNFMMSCPPGISTLDRNQSLNVQGYLPLTRSGTVTVTIETRVFTIPQNQHGTINTQGPGQVDDWSAIALTVAAQIPSDRLLSLQAQGNTVKVNVSASMRPHLVYFYTVTCMHGSGTNDGWEPLKATILPEPYCDDPLRHWTYAVSAPGYAIAALSMGI